MTARVPIYVTVREACEHLSIGRTTLYRLLRDGELKSSTLGRARRISLASIIDYLERHASQ